MNAWGFALDPARAALLCAGRGVGWWWPGCPVVADPHRLWVLGPDRARPVALVDVEQVGRDGEDLIAIAGRTRVRLTPTGEIREEVRRGHRPVVGAARIWLDDGFVYRSAGDLTRAVDVHRRAEQVAVGPHGALLAGVDSWTRGGAPGRSPRPLARTLLPSPIRWAEDGGSVAGLDEDEQGVVIDLRTGAAVPFDGTPVGVDVRLIDGEIVGLGGVLRRDVREASSARWGERLAGPGGRVWSLSTGRAVGERGVIALGATVATPSGFVTVDWATHRGAVVDRDGQRVAQFQLDLDPDDTVIAGRWDAGAVHLETALGEQLRVVNGAVEAGDQPVDPPEDPVDVQTPAGSFEAADVADVGGHRFAWNDDGWLLAWPLVAPSPPHRGSGC